MRVRGLCCLVVSFSLLTLAIPVAMGQRKTPSQNAPSTLTARDYYNELYKSGGLDNFADEYVCFRDDQEPVFFLVSDSETLKTFLVSVGSYDKLTAKEKARLNEGLAFFVQYHNGLSNGMEYFDREARGQYAEKLVIPQQGQPSFHVTKVLRINWDTLRYELDVQRTGYPQTLYADTGKCEQVNSAVHQHGH